MIKLCIIYSGWRAFILEKPFLVKCLQRLQCQQQAKLQDKIQSSEPNTVTWCMKFWIVDLTKNWL